MKPSELAENFFAVTKGEKKNINSVISKTHSDKVVANCKALTSILEVITNLGQRNIALRGTWKGNKEDGNFNHFFSWKSKFDASLKQHLEAAPRNAKYIIPTILNELIACCEAEIRSSGL